MTELGKSVKSKTARLLGLLAAGATFLLLGPVALYRSASTLLTVDSGPCQAPAIVVLGGDAFARPLRAAELFKPAAASLVIASGAGDCGEVVAALKQYGVPPSSIIREDSSRNTKQNAEFTAPLLRNAKVTDAIIVTSWYHSRRALKTFRHAAPDIRFYSRPSYFAFARQDWSRKHVARRIRVEYLKLLGYWVRYGICPF